MKDPIAKRTELNIGEFVVRPAVNQIAGERIEPKAMDVLLALAEASPEPVAAQELLDRVWPDRVVVDNVVHKAIARLRKAFGDDPQHPRYIETVPRRGYRLIAAPASPEPTNQTVPSVTIAVCPFTNLTNDPSLDRFAQIVIEDIERHAARLQLLQLRKTSLNQEKPTEYVIDGSVRRSHGSVVVSYNLIRQADERQLLTDALQVEDADVANSDFRRAPHVAQMAQGTIRSLVNAGFMDTTEEVRELVTLHGFEWIRILLGANGDWGVGVHLLEQAIRFDPAFALPYALLSVHYAHRLGNRISAAEALSRANEAVATSLELAPDAWLSRYVLGVKNLELDLNYDAALENFDEALAAGAPLGVVSERIGLTYLAQGRIAEAIDRFKTATAGDAWMDQGATSLWWGLALLATESYAEAVTLFDRAWSLMGESGWFPANVQLGRARAFYHLGDLTRASVAADRAWRMLGATQPECFPGVMALTGRGAEAERLLAAAEARHADGDFVYATEMFRAYHHLGDSDRAFSWLHKAIENRENRLFHELRSSPALAGLRDDSRFLEAMNRLAEIESGGSI